MRRSCGTRGQAITEYVVVVSAVAVGTGVVVYGFLGYVSEFYINVFKFICLPFP